MNNITKQIKPNVIFVPHNEHFLLNKESTDFYVKYSLYQVSTHNDGTPVESKVLQELLTEIVDFAGGATILPPGRGMWVDNNRKIFEDIVSVIEVVVPSSPEAEAFFLSWSTRAALLLDQECILITCHPISYVTADVMTEKAFQVPFEK